MSVQSNELLSAAYAVFDGHTRGMTLGARSVLVVDDDCSSEIRYTQHRLKNQQEEEPGKARLQAM